MGLSEGPANWCRLHCGGSIEQIHSWMLSPAFTMKELQNNWMIIIRHVVVAMKELPGLETSTYRSVIRVLQYSCYVAATL